MNNFLPSASINVLVNCRTDGTLQPWIDEQSRKLSDFNGILKRLELCQEVMNLVSLYAHIHIFFVLKCSFCSQLYGKKYFYLI